MSLSLALIWSKIIEIASAIKGQDFQTFYRLDIDIDIHRYASTCAEIRISMPDSYDSFWSDGSHHTRDTEPYECSDPYNCDGGSLCDVGIHCYSGDSKLGLPPLQLSGDTSIIGPEVIIISDDDSEVESKPPPKKKAHKGDEPPLKVVDPISKAAGPAELANLTPKAAPTAPPGFAEKEYVEGTFTSCSSDD